VRNGLIAGAVGGVGAIAVYEGAKYILRDNHATVPYRNRNYYFTNTVNIVSKTNRKYISEKEIVRSQK
jgi:hypothetical protein